MRTSRIATLDSEGRTEFGRIARGVVRSSIESSYSFLVFAMVCLIIGFSAIVPRFFSVTNLYNIFIQSSVVGLTAIGMTFVIVAKGIDISVGAVAALVGMLVGLMLVANVPVAIAVLLVILFGMAIGLANGLLITRLGLAPFLVTLAMMATARGGAFAVTLAQPVKYFPSSFSFLGLGYLGPVPFSGILLVIMFLIGYYLLGYTAFGRSVFAIGGNPEAARMAGIRSQRVVTLCYVICAALAALAGVILTARLDQAWSTAADGLEFQAITAVVIGGGSLSGGRGSMFGTFLGVFVIGLLNNGLSILNVNAFQIELVNGVLIFLVIVVDRIRALLRRE